MGEIIELSPEEFRRMQLVQLDMIAELDRVCRANDINYVIFCGTMLGAVRHKGYIPWDDDADVGMLREDYEKFKKVTDQLNEEICYFQDHETDPEYRWGYGKLRRTGTTFIRVGQEHMKGKTGVFIDIFPLDDIPESTIGRVLQDFKCFFWRKVLWSEVGKYSAKGLTKVWFNILSKIKVDTAYKHMRKYQERSSNSSPNRVRTLLFPSFGKQNKQNSMRDKYGLKKEWILNRKEYEFEGHTFYGTADYDAILKYLYNDYMTLPPEDKRDPHAPVSSYHF